MTYILNKQPSMMSDQRICCCPDVTSETTMDEYQNYQLLISSKMDNFTAVGTSEDANCRCAVCLYLYR